MFTTTSIHEISLKVPLLKSADQDPAVRSRAQGLQFLYLRAMGNIAASAATHQDEKVRRAGTASLSFLEGIEAFLDRNAAGQPYPQSATIRPDNTAQSVLQETYGHPVSEVVGSYLPANRLLSGGIAEVTARFNAEGIGSFVRLGARIDTTHGVLIARSVPAGVDGMVGGHGEMSFDTIGQVGELMRDMLSMPLKEVE